MTKDLVVFTEVPAGTYSVTYHNGVSLGELYREIDGFFVFSPILRGGFWEAAPMRTIADKLDELNAPWENELERMMAE